MRVPFRIVAAKLKGLFGQPKADGEFDEEVREHLQLLTDRFLHQGMSYQEAAAAAPTPIWQHHVVAAETERDAHAADAGHRWTRSALWCAATATQSLVYLDRYSLAGAGNRREHSHFYGCEEGVVRYVAGTEPAGTADADMGERS